MSEINQDSLFYSGSRGECSDIYIIYQVDKIYSTSKIRIKPTIKIVRDSLMYNMPTLVSDIDGDVRIISLKDDDWKSKKERFYPITLEKYIKLTDDPKPKN